MVPVLALTADEIAIAAASLAPRLVGAQVQRVWQPTPETLVLAAYGPAGLVYPVLACAPEFARLGEAEGKPASKDPPHALGQWLRAVALGQPVTGLDALPGERLVRLTFPGGAVLAELFGRGANLYGLDADGVIRAVARPVDGQRENRAGMPWQPPPPRTTSSTVAAAPARPRFADARATEAAARDLEAAAARDADTLERARWFRSAYRKLDRLEAALTRDAAGLEDFEHHRLCGELLTAQWASLKLPRGASRAVVANWYAEGAPPLEIPLDPALDGPRNIERLFARYRKGRDGLETVRTRRAETAERRSALASLEAAAPALDDSALRAALRRLGLATPNADGSARGQGSGGRREAPERLPYRPFTSRAGERILVGRGGADNHALTFRVARGNDLWLHVRDAPGAHVVVPQPARGRPPHPETLLDAAALAMHHSDLRGEAIGDVTLTERKHVRAVPGGPPGRVTVAAARTLTVTDPELRIERLYAVAERGAPP
jgi:predicted ribosome quality control (RQC) complex YloA/Tae2 family protein